jgi:hypothetical protein
MFSYLSNVFAEYFASAFAVGFSFSGAEESKRAFLMPSEPSFEA